MNLSFKQGKISALLGPNGAGKTTTISMMLGLMKPTSGEVRMLGSQAGVAQMVIHLIVIVVIFLTAALAHDIELTAVQWISCGMWLWLGSIPMLGLGALLGTLKNANTSIAIGNVLQMGLAIVGGLWMPLQNLPTWMQSIGQWLPSHSYASGAWNMVAGHMPGMSNFIILAGYGLLFMVLSVYIFNRREAV
ncbi:ATP-binding cassette domain-containing protein [Paenibacillus sp. GSMTC-2017]|uniref:ATP-binding cassette domain-containing protein n=1 Tax=Paenibacillus sp. GSMTC-2017 TaxID=2794350 RepID=UPI003FA7AB2A